MQKENIFKMQIYSKPKKKKKKKKKLKIILALMIKNCFPVKYIKNKPWWIPKITKFLRRK